MPPKGFSFATQVIGAGAIIDKFEAMQHDLGTVKYVVGTNVNYSVHVEFGTSRMQAQPYLRPAVEHVARNAQNIFDKADSLTAAIAEIALEIEKEAKRLCPVDTGNLRASIKAEKVN